MNRNLVNSKLDKYRERGKGTYTFCQVCCNCNIAVNLLEKCENLQFKIDKAIEILNDGLKELDKRNRCEVYSEEYLENARDILKEDR